MAKSTPTTANPQWLARPGPRALFGALVVAASVLYFATDVVETTQGGFSITQLWLTLVAESLVPPMVVGLAFTQGPRFGRVGWASTWIYAYSYVYFSATVIYAIANDTPDYATLSDDLGVLMLFHGALMVIGGLGIGAAALRAGVMPRWAALALMAGVVLVAVGQNLPEAAQTMVAGVRDLGFAGMGLSLMRWPTDGPFDMNAPAAHADRA